jgi:hypothetical protein
MRISKKGVPMKRTTILLPDGLWWKVKEQAAREHRDAQDVVSDALERYLREARKGGGSK